MSDPQLVVLAAGVGRRYGGLKQIDSIGPGGEVLLDYTLYDALAAGFDRIVFVIREEIREPFRERFGHRIESRADVEYVFQSLDDLPDGFHPPADREKPWGTAHAVLCADRAVDGPFAVVNADDFYGRRTFDLLYRHFRNGSPSDGDSPPFCLVGFTLSDTLSDHGHVSRGICRMDDDGFLDEIVERKKIRRSGERVESFDPEEEQWLEMDPSLTVSMNAWGFTEAFMTYARERFPVFLSEQGREPGAEFMIPPLVNRMIDEGRAKVVVHSTDQDWFGMTYREDRAEARNEIRQRIDAGQYPEQLWSSGPEG